MPRTASDAEQHARRPNKTEKRLETKISGSKTGRRVPAWKMGRAERRAANMTREGRWSETTKQGWQGCEIRVRLPCRDQLRRDRVVRLRKAPGFVQNQSKTDSPIWACGHAHAGRPGRRRTLASENRSIKSSAPPRSWRRAQRFARSPPLCWPLHACLLRAWSARLRRLQTYAFAGDWHRAVPI
jgi:hypothetical protein